MKNKFLTCIIFFPHQPSPHTHTHTQNNTKTEITNFRTELTNIKAQIAELEAALSKVELADRLGCTANDLKSHMMDCPVDRLGQVIGKGGSNIKKLAKTSIKN